MRRSAAWPWAALVAVLVAASVVLFLRTPATVQAALPLPPAGTLPASPGNPEPSRAASRCPQGMGSWRAWHGDDASLVFGGRLAVPASAWPYEVSDVPQENTFPGMYDAAMGYETPVKGWGVVAGLAEIDAAGYYATLRGAATTGVTCMANDDESYPGRLSVDVLSDQKTTVDGRDAWLYAARVNLDPAKSHTIAAETITVVVVDDGREDRFSILFASSVDASAQREIERLPSLATVVT